MGITMKHKVSELEGALLDAAVAKANGDWPFLMLRWPQLPWLLRSRPYSSEWEYGGPIMERKGIWLSCDDAGEWVASFFPHSESGPVDGPPDVKRIFEGPTPLIAAMRAFVASKFGEEVEL